MTMWPYFPHGDEDNKYVSNTDTVFTSRPFLMRITLPYLMWDRSAMSVIPVIFGLARCGAL